MGALRSLWPGGSKTYTYDAAGRTTQVVAPNGTTNIVYDFESRITSLTCPGITQTSVYNGLDTRVSTTVNNSTRAFGRDGIYVTDPVLTHGTDTSFTPGISERRSGTTTFLHSGLKNADAQSSTAQAITATRTYDAFGMIRSSTGTWRGPFGYAGGFGYQEDASGLRLLGHRYYDASTGRFLTRDPIKDGRNWYAYGAGEANPLTGADPSGLVKIVLFWYHVAGGGHHAGLLIIDNRRGKTEPTYSYSGGPTFYDFFNSGALISRSGPWKPGTQDFGRWNGGGIVLVDDNSRIEPWLQWFNRVEAEMANDTDAAYDPVPGVFGNTGNSNSWLAEFLERVGLEDEYNSAITKKGGAPWVPGWGKDVWKD